MAKPRSDERRTAIMSAAVRVVASQGIGAPTAMIAKEADISNGSLFTYFETKSMLLNQLYTELKAEVAEVALHGLRDDADDQAQLLRIWQNWLRWTVRNPEKRRALAQLSVSDEITPTSRAAAHQAMDEIAGMIERCRATGPLQDAPLAFVSALMSAMADTTADFMISDPSHADAHCAAGFVALWRMLAQ